MLSISKIKNLLLKSRLLTHLLFWGAVVFLLAYHGSFFGGDFWENSLYMLSILPIQMIAAYLLVYLQIPFLLHRKGLIPFIATGIIIGYILAALARASVIYIGEPMMGIEGIDESIWEIITDPIYLIRVYLMSAYLPSFLFLLIKLAKESFAKENQFVALEKEKQTNELNFLKAQINPHFLFNTLNNIYALSKNQSKDTPEMILKLSEILDYTIYECKNDKVPIKREWELIENYADLQALRHHNQLTILLHQDIENEEGKIAPLILISLVENAFKHGLKDKRQGATINISLIEKSGKIIFDIYNTCSNQELESRKGIGLQNINRQLELQYPNQYAIEVDNQKNSYRVTLKIALKTT